MIKNVAIVYGGLSTEREISLRTGKAIFEALQSKPYHVTLIDADRNLVNKLSETNPDVAVIALHGKYGEDGCIQGLLEILGIPYTGPGVLASSIAMNKIMTKKLLSYEGIPTPGFMVLNGTERNPADLAKTVLAKFSLPLVVKAANQGSSIGVCFAFDSDGVLTAIEECSKYDKELLLEEYIKGKELTVSVLGNKDPIALPILEITSTTGLYDYHAKYTAGVSQHFVADLPPKTELLIKELAVRTYQAIGCAGLSRVDFMLSEDNQPWVLEVNTSPGMTATSLFPDAARAAGISFPDLIEKLINMALENHQA